MSFTSMIPWRRNREGLARRSESDPFEHMSNLMQRWFGDWGADWGLEPFDAGAGETGRFLPSVDVKDAGKEITVSAELPGLDEKDVELTLERDRLIIKGEKKSEHEEKRGDYQHVERRYGQFQRVIPLGVEVDEDKVQAEFKKGVLTVHLPKSPEAVSASRRIEVKSG